MVVQPGESMTPDTCPFCGAQRTGRPDYIPLLTTGFCCGTWAARHHESDQWRSHQSPECARYVRTRISQLRRMAEACEVRFERWSNGSVLAETRFPEWWIHRRNDQYRRVASACLREITRLQEAQRGTA